MARTVELQHRPHQPKGGRGLDAAQRIGNYLLRLSLIGLILALLFLLYGLFSGDYSKFPYVGDTGTLLTTEERATLLANLRGALLLFVICGWIASALGLLLFWETQVPPLIVGGLGLLSYLGIPMLIAAVLTRQGVYDELNPNQITASITAAAQVIGKVGMVFALVRFVGHGLFAVALGPSRRRGKAPEPAAKAVENAPAKARPSAHLIRRCWEMAFCSESLRDHCPSYKTHTACWKRRTGCHCDPYFAVRIMEPIERARGTVLSEDEERTRAHLSSNPTWLAKQHATKETCRQCAIYIEHQHYKYRAVFWLAYPIAGGLVFLAWPLIHRGYDWAEVTLTKMAHGMSALPNTNPELEPFINTVVGVDVEIVIVAAVALLIVTSLVRFFEWAIFEQMV